MRACLSVVALSALLLITTAAHGKKTHQMDIALEGPWILYQDDNFDNNGRRVPVLVAIAPASAFTKASAIARGAGDKLHHHPPQVSTGDGFYIDSPGIYCVAFDHICAKKGPAHLDWHEYPKPNVLTMTFHDRGNKQPWPWVEKSKGHVVLLLPIPNSYSNDGVWPIRFRSQFTLDPPDVAGSWSIGVALHYAHGPIQLQLLKCDGGKPTVGNCKEPAKEKQRDIAMGNTGTLRIHMRAPDNPDACDHHVRFGYHKMFEILKSPPFNTQYAYIEPAKAATSDANGDLVGTFEDSKVDHECFDADTEQRGSKGSEQHQHDEQMPQAAALQAENPIVNANFLQTQLLDIINTQVIENLNQVLSHNLSEDLKKAAKAANDAKVATEALDPVFPRISEVRRIGALLSESNSAIELFEKNNAPSDVDRRKLEIATEGTETGAAATKNGGDCRAPIVIME